MLVDIDAKLISERDFEGTWGAHVKSNGDLFLWSEVASLPVNRVWTVYDVDDVRAEGRHYLHSYATPGMVPSMASGYVVTDKPWTSETPDAIWYWDDDEDGAIERYEFMQEVER